MSLPTPALSPIVFSHANGFPAGTYRALFEVWQAAGHAVHAIERLGHHPHHPVGENWLGLRDQLLAFADAQVPAAPAWFVGHSLGGVLSLMAAAQRPARVAGVVLLDAPVVAGWRAHTLRWAKASGLIGRLSPGHIARKRRTEWPSREAVHQHFAGKPAFARWHPQVLQDYVDCGFATGPGRANWRLAFDRDIEARIYDNLPHHLPSLLARHPLRCPVGFIGGRQSAEMRQAGVAATRRLVGPRLVWTEGSHLFPMEHPGTAAQLVLDMLAGMAAG